MPDFWKESYCQGEWVSIWRITDTCSIPGLELYATMCSCWHFSTLPPNRLTSEQSAIWMFEYIFQKKNVSEKKFTFLQKLSHISKSQNLLWSNSHFIDLFHEKKMFCFFWVEKTAFWGNVLSKHHNLSQNAITKKFGQIYEVFENIRKRRVEWFGTTTCWVANHGDVPSLYYAKH